MICSHNIDRMAYIIFSPILLSKYRPTPLSNALTKKIAPKIAIMPQFILLTENLSTKRPVNRGTNKPLKLPNEVIMTAAMINPYGHESL